MRVAFIPKEGKAGCTDLKSFRPIHRMYFFLKTLKKIVLRHLARSTCGLPPHANEHSHITGRSCDSAVYHMICKIEKDDKEALDYLSGLSGH